MSVFFHLFIEFFQIGLFAVGGGPATIPFLMDLPSRYDWYQVSDVANMLAVSESTPGPIGINMATYAGYNAAGFPGGIAATLSLVLPSIIVIVIIAGILDKFSKSMYIKSSFALIRPVVTGLIGTAVYGIFNTALFTDANGEFHIPVTLLLICIGFYALMCNKKLKKLHPFFWIVAGACMGLVMKL
ncbi:MAG: chromate transporter [Lachnospiraceae bacterium]|nr:chromate transporter [Lachnospiraceae bacterium]